MAHNAIPNGRCQRQIGLCQAGYAAPFGALAINCTQGWGSEGWGGQGWRRHSLGQIGGRFII
jgi:hypothetical protein